MAALRRRDSAAAKLKDSVRQLRRYLDADSSVERILTQKIDKVDIDREELIARHHEYAEKTDNVNIEDDAMLQYLTPKIDEAVDIVDDATVKMEELSSTSQVNIENTQHAADTQRKRLELASAKLQADSCKRLLETVLNEIDDTIAKPTPTNEDAITVESALTELEIKEEEINKSWNEVMTRLTDTQEIENMIRENEDIRGQKYS